MRFELPTQLALGHHGAGEDDEAARLLVEALDDAQARQRPFADAALAPGQERGHEVFQRRG